jgi:histidinol-phosphate/aromatic aminotransferase/cobyric acid decarboxylase-like protein/adenosyl cobinamide kinase/adenosyl cobinamide phosphate guanylyltransferase
VTLSLIIGGTRSGKSARAEQLAHATGLPVRYVGTADPQDRSMAGRIEVHRSRRPGAWSTVTAGADLAAVFRGFDGCVLLDGLGPWIAARLHEGLTADAIARAGGDAALMAAKRLRAAIVVAEQAGEGLLPMDALSRTWLDVLGEVTQAFAAAADRVELVVAGRPLALAPPAAPGAIDQLRTHGDTAVRRGDADHAVNVIAGGPPAWLRAELQAALKADAARYPSERRASTALAARHGRAAAEIVATNGAAEALWLLGPALRPSLAACIHPGFTEAEAGLHAHGVPVVRVLRDPERSFELDPAAVPEAADLVIVGNPASPSGTLSPAAAVLALRRPARIVVVDEAFMDLVPGEPGSLSREPLDDVIVVRSVTKVLSIPGLRAGYAIAPEPLAARLRAARPPWSCNALALAALAAAAANEHELAVIASRAADERADLAARLEALDCVRVWPGVANFVLIDVADGPGAVAALRSAGIAVRHAASFPGLGAGHIRITARSPAENERVASALNHHFDTLDVESSAECAESRV